MSTPPNLARTPGTTKRHSTGFTICANTSNRRNLERYHRQQIALSQPLPLDRNAAAVYLASLPAETGRRTQAQTLLRSQKWQAAPAYKRPLAMRDGLRKP